MSICLFTPKLFYLYDSHRCCSSGLGFLAVAGIVKDGDHRAHDALMAENDERKRLLNINSEVTKVWGGVEVCSFEMHVMCFGFPIYLFGTSVGWWLDVYCGGKIYVPECYDDAQYYSRPKPRLHHPLEPRAAGLMRSLFWHQFNHSITVFVSFVVQVLLDTSGSFAYDGDGKAAGQVVVPVKYIPPLRKGRVWIGA